jgi:hypothetical protein
MDNLVAKSTAGAGIAQSCMRAAGFGWLFFIETGTTVGESDT